MPKVLHSSAAEMSSNERGKLCMGRCSAGGIATVGNCGECAECLGECCDILEKRMVSFFVVVAVERQRGFVRRVWRSMGAGGLKYQTGNGN